MFIFFGLLYLIQLISLTASSDEGTVEIQKLSQDVNTALRQISKRSGEGVNGLCTEIGDLITNINKTLEEIDSLEEKLIPALKQWRKANNLRFQVDDLTLFKRSIDSEYTKLYQHLKENNNNCSECAVDATVDLVDGILGNGLNSVVNIIKGIYSDLDPFKQERDSAVKKLHELFLQADQNPMHLCSAPSFPQQILYSYLKFAIVAEIKSYVLQVFAYNYKKIFYKGIHDKEISEVEDRYSTQVKTLFKHFRKLMQTIPKHLWKCDPSKHILGITYEPITKLIQGYIINEENLSNNGTCFNSCSDFKFVESPYCRFGNLCRYQPTCPKIFDCIPTDLKLNVCINQNGFQGRLYDFVELRNKKKHWGNLSLQNSCRPISLDVHSYYHWNCNYCFCKCDRPSSSSDRYINLRASLADFKNNRIVTGVRFIKRNRIIHLQVQEGVVLPFAKINDSSLQWVPVDEYKITERKVYEGQDYHTFTFNERALDLVDVMADPGQVVIGVRFRKVYGSVTLQILQTPFNFTTGKLVHENKGVVAKNSDCSSCPKLELVEPDIPIKSSEPSLPNSKTGQYIEFTHSDLQKDAAQTTVPFFDIQSVVSLQPVPLSGVGIFHKGREGYGGFIAPKIIAYDIADHLLL